MEDEAMRLAAVAYLRKPFDEQCLLDAIGFCNLALLIS
jgi:FixJ family two-component response regulator